MDDAIEVLLEVVLPTAILAAVLLVAAGLLANALVSYECSSYERVTGKETKYAYFDSCYIKTADGWQRWEEYKARAVTNESKASD